jgi:N-carbamoylputrescine amidase
MPFYSWFAREPDFNPAVWQAAVSTHETWMARLSELAPAAVLGTRPVEHEGRRLNEAFAWHAESGYQAVHHKYYLPDETGFWESSWYSKGNGNFISSRTMDLTFGFLVCSEMWFTQHAREYGKVGAHLLATPRATPRNVTSKWLAGGRTAAVVSGAYHLSSNNLTPSSHLLGLGGQGWIIDPNGQVLGLTSEERPFLTLEIDLQAAEHAKKTYPRYIKD